jgi:hypothetical protein
VIAVSNCAEGHYHVLRKDSATWTELQCSLSKTAVSWFRRLVAGLSLRRTWFLLASVFVGFVADKVALGQVFLRFILHSLVNIIPTWHSIFVYNLGMNNMPVGSRNSVTSSHHIDMNNKKNKVVRRVSSSDRCSVNSGSK